MYYYDTTKKLFHIALKSDKLPEWRSFCGKELFVWKESLMTEKIPDDGALCTKCLQMVGPKLGNKTIEDEVRQKIQKKADYMHDKAQIAYNAFLMLQKLSECSKSHAEEIALSQEFYFTIYTSSRSLIFDTIENFYKNENRGETIGSLLSNCKNCKRVFREAMSFEYRADKDIKYCLPFEIQLPKLWEDVDVDYEFDFGGIEQDEDQPYITLRCDFFHFFEFMNGLWNMMKGLAEKVKQSRKKEMEKNDGGMEDWMAEMRNKQSSRYWKYVQVLLQYQLILSAFIQSALIPYSAENRREVQAIPYENAADLENTLNAVRQRLDAQPTIV